MKTAFPFCFWKEKKKKQLVDSQENEGFSCFKKEKKRRNLLKRKNG
jgi:hypothetical protein